jgi:hypothetical protein
MLRGFRWLALVGVVVIAALVGPSVALACGGSSAVDIYHEQLCGAKGSQSGKKHSPTKTQSGPPAPTTGQGAGFENPYGSTPKPVHVSHKTQRVLAHAGKDKDALTNLVTNPNYVDAQRLTVLASAPVRQSSLGSTFDLGSGPMILFALLLGTVLVLLGAGGVRTWRNRHRA